MIFVGDIALPYKGAIKFNNFPKDFYQKSWFGNLEGPIVTNNDNSINAVYNNSDAIDELTKTFNYKGFGLANNHIFDTGTYNETIAYLNKNNLYYTGIGSNLFEANNEIVIEKQHTKIIIVNFGWEVIQCEITKGNEIGVNPLRKSHVLDTINDLLVKYPNAYILTFMHWSFELEAEPQPFERELAKKLIDLGVSGVIGCHPHRVGGVEFYKDKPIIYSLGNWLFKQNYFFDKKLSFPDFCNLQLAFEWNFETNEMLFHFFEFNKIKSELNFLKTEKLNHNNELLKKHTPFEGLSNAEYIKWYKKNHYHKNKGLPIFYWEDNNIMYSIKSEYMKIRDKALKILLNKGK